MAQLKIGDPAPLFTGKDQNGKEISLAQLKGKKVILYFYPKDNTPGCTAEACNLRDNYSGLRSKGFEVIGVSGDSEASHQKFIGKFNLPFTLISDPGHKILESYSAWGKKTLYGRVFNGILRKTFVIDEKGIITAIFDKVDTKNHTSQIFQELKIKE
jgi:thioredoxin-dependent peroxiredoxin